MTLCPFIKFLHCFLSLSGHAQSLMLKPRRDSSKSRTMSYPPFSYHGYWLHFITNCIFRGKLGLSLSLLLAFLIIQEMCVYKISVSLQRLFWSIKLKYPRIQCLELFVYIYIYAFSRHFYPKRLTVHSGYTFIQMTILSVCVFPGNRTHNLCAANTMP